MKTGVRIRVAEMDPDYLGIEIMASNGRYAGTTWIFAGLDQLSTFAKQVAGFPRSPSDDRNYEFGSRDPHIAGGYCGFRFYCVDGKGHPAVELDFEDDDQRFTSGTCILTLSVQPADIDRFCKELREIERERAGEAYLPIAV